MRPENPPRQRERGFVTLPALTILLLLATVAAVAAAYLSSSATSLAFYDDRLRSQALVLAGVELVAYDLLSGEKSDRKPKGSIAFKLDNAFVNVDYATETSRIDLNFAPREVLAKLFEVLGATRDDASGYAERIAGWRTPLKQSALDREIALYREADLSYGPKGAAFSSEDELWLIPGLPPPLVERMLQFVTIYSGRREVDVFGAAPEVVASLPGVEPMQAATFIAQREEIPHAPTAVINLLGTGSGLVSIYSQDNVRLNCTVVLANGWHASAEIVIQLQGSEEPYVVLSWRDADRGDSVAPE
jgi:general secretion pathway protein K